jgi:DNA modification methylase
MTDSIPLSSIVEGDRARKQYGDLTGLANSLKTLGSIHPIVLSKENNGSFRLIAGGRRLRAMKDAEFTEVFHGSILEPGRVGFLFRDEVPEDVLKEAELDENLYRLKPKWQEDVCLIADVHEVKQKKEGHKWGQRQTSELLGSGYGLSNVNHAIRLAKLVRASDKDILACETMSDAISVLVKRKEDEALAELQRRAMPSATSPSSFLDTLNINIGGKRGDVIATGEELPGSTLGDSDVQPAESPSVGEPVVVHLSKMFVLGDAIVTMSAMPESCIDHVVTDIPYGIDTDNMDTLKNISDVEAEHDVAENLALMEPFLKQTYRLVKSGGFCVFFYDLDHHEKLQVWARDIGWRVQRWPYVACKTSACQNNAAQYNFTKNYEVAMILRKDEKTVLRSQQSTSWKAYDFNAERRLYNNPFAKPFELWKDLYSAIAFQGQTVLDPFCGEMSACRAAVNCGLIPFGIEINEQRFNRGLEHMRAVYALLHKSNVQFV